MEISCEDDKKMKILCLHGFRTSGSFLKKQISKWDPSIFANFDLEFPDGLYPAGGKSEIEGFFPPPYYEWFQFNKEFTEYTNLEECISYLCNYITTHGPFDGLLGFSQGATLSALLMGYQSQGKVLKDHPPFKFFISVSGSKFRIPSICEVAYKEPNKAKSVHFIGEKDWLKLPSEDLAAAFQDPLIIRHPQGHTVPRLEIWPPKSNGTYMYDREHNLLSSSPLCIQIIDERMKQADEEATEKLLNWVKELLVQTRKAKDCVQNVEAQKEQEKTEEACEAAKVEHNFTEKREVEVVQA